MAGTFLDDFTGDLLENTIIKELQIALDKAVRLSPKSTITAHYPKNDYDSAIFRMHVQANLEAIRKNPNNKRGIKIYADGIFPDGTCSFDVEPNFATIDMSYTEFSKLTTLKFCQDVVSPLHKRMMSWDEVHDAMEETDPFNAFGDEDEGAVSNSEPEFDEIKILLEKGDKIQAIGLYREIMGVGLAEAKDAVEQYIQDNNITIPNSNTQNNNLAQPTSVSNSQQQTNNSSSSGCLTAAIMIGLFIIFVIIKLSDLF